MYGYKIVDGKAVIDETEAEIITAIFNGYISGMSLRDARDTLSYYGLYLNALSPLTDPEKQTVSSQSVPAGTALPHGSVVEVTLIDSDEAMLGRY